MEGIYEMNGCELKVAKNNNWSTICRLCLSVDEKLFQLFRPNEIETSAVTLSMKASLCTSLRLSKNDELPQKICETCLNYINEWYKFRKKCVRADSILKNHVNSRSDNGEKEESGKTEEIDNKLKYCNINFDDNDGDDGNFNNDVDDEQFLFGSEMLPTDSYIRENKLTLNSLNDAETIKMCIKKNGESVKKCAAKPPKRKFKCLLCPDSFYYLKDLKRHKQLIHNLVKTVDKVTKKSTLIVDADVKLEGVNMRTRYEMKCCNKIFFTKARFRRHYNLKHPGEKPFMCEQCGKKDFISEETLKRHKVLHSGKYRCEICDKTFTCNAILIIHKRDKHENDKPFICDVCGKRFVTELLMNYHKRFHTGEKKYVCEECGLAVVTSSSLAKHKRTHSSIRPYVCQVCGKGFIIKGRLVEHERIHTGERPYSCEICKKTFTMRDKLKRHILIHSGEKLFSCEYCGNSYSTNYGLSVHLKTHVVRSF